MFERVAPERELGELLTELLGRDRRVPDLAPAGAELILRSGAWLIRRRLLVNHRPDDPEDGEDESDEEHDDVAVLPSQHPGRKQTDKPEEAEHSSVQVPMVEGLEHAAPPLLALAEKRLAGAQRCCCASRRTILRTTSTPTMTRASRRSEIVQPRAKSGTSRPRTSTDPATIA